MSSELREAVDALKRRVAYRKTCFPPVREDTRIECSLTLHEWDAVLTALAPDLGPISPPTKLISGAKSTIIEAVRERCVGECSKYDNLSGILLPNWAEGKRAGAQLCIKAIRNLDLSDLMQDNGLSPEVVAFARLMQKKLDENAHKGGWEDESLQWLCSRAHVEFNELVSAIENNDREAIPLEAADVGNFLMMICDNHDRRTRSRGERR